MMRRMYAMRDTKVGFMSPLLDENDATAMRNFRLAVSSNAIMKLNPNDYELYYIGEYDTDNGVISPVWPLQLVLRGSDADV